MSKKAPATTEKKQARDSRFKPGQSGNPAGRPAGSRHKATLAAQSLLDGESEALTRKCVELALEGNLAALKLCLERLVPIAKDRPVKIKLPATVTAEGIEKAGDRVLKAVSTGELTPSEGAVIAGILKERRLVMETSEFERRLSELEEKVESKR